MNKLQCECGEQPEWADLVPDVHFKRAGASTWQCRGCKRTQTVTTMVKDEKAQKRLDRRMGR